MPAQSNFMFRAQQTFDVQQTFFPCQEYVPMSEVIAALEQDQQLWHFITYKSYDSRIVKTSIVQ